MINQSGQIFTSLAPELSEGVVLRENEPMAKKTTLRVGGRADIYAEPASEADLAKLLQFCSRSGLPYMILGRGSNLLIRDGGIRGLVISLAHANFSQIEVSGGHLLCGAGAKLKTIATEARRNSLCGFEFLEGIPGSLGGALRMNAGAMGSSLFDLVEKLRFMDGSGQVLEKPASEIPFQYRSCELLKSNIALGAVLRGTTDSMNVISARMKSFSEKRWEMQPKEPSAGCTFKNPEKMAAGKLIDQLGLKGLRVGGASVSHVHANFIINDGSATARDVLELISLIVDRVKCAEGIELKTEVEIVGED